MYRCTDVPAAVAVLAEQHNAPTGGHRAPSKGDPPLSRLRTTCTALRATPLPFRSPALLVLFLVPPRPLVSTRRET